MFAVAVCYVSDPARTRQEQYLSLPHTHTHSHSHLTRAEMTLHLAEGHGPLTHKPVHYKRLIVSYEGDTLALIPSHWECWMVIYTYMMDLSLPS